MKKLFLMFGLLAATSFMFTSCSDDDEGDKSYEQLYGTWEVFQIFESGTMTEFNLCSQKETYVFSGGGTYQLTTYTGEDFTSCQEDSTLSGSWEYLGNRQYLIHPNSVTITDENRDNYTFVLTYTTISGVTLMNKYTLANNNNGVSTYTSYAKQ